MRKIVFVLVLLGSSLTSYSQNKSIDISKSNLTWIGKKITGQHEGTLQFKQGTLLFSKNKLIGGAFTVDMTSLTNTDQKGKDKLKLENHLKSTDFFDTSHFKTAQLLFKSIAPTKNNTYVVKADLTIKGVTNKVEFDLTINQETALAKVIIDRTKYGIQYGSGSFFEDLGDRTIYDEFEINVFLFLNE